MSPPQPAICPFDWKNGENHQLSGGEVIGLTEHLFAYGFSIDGLLGKAFVASQHHSESILSLLTAHPDELAELLTGIFGRLRDAAYNLYANVGKVAGLTVEDHPHLHVIRRNAGEPAENTGLEKLIRDFNRLSGAHQQLTHDYERLSAAYGQFAWNNDST